MRENLSLGLANNKSADNAACAFAQSDQCFYNLLIGKYHIINLRPAKFQFPKLVELVGFSLTWSETLKTGFLTSPPIFETEKYICKRYKMACATIKGSNQPVQESCLWHLMM